MLSRITRWFSNRPIRTKLVFAIMPPMILLAVGGLGFFSAYQIESLKGDKVREVQHFIQAIAQDVAEVKYLGGQADYADLSTRLASFQDIKQLWVFESGGASVYYYEAPGGSLKRPAVSGRPSAEFRDGFLRVYEPVVWNGKAVGTAYILSDATRVSDKIDEHILLVVAVGLGLTLVAVFQIWALSFFTSKPIEALAGSLQAVANTKAYTLRHAIRGDDEVGKLGQSFNAMMDQTETTNRELQDSETRNRSILNTIIDGIVTIDDMGIIESFNPAAQKMFGYTEAEVTGRNISMLVPPPHRDKHDDYIAEYRRTGQSLIIGQGREVSGLTKGGERFPLYIAVTEMRLGDKRFFVGLVQDITERKTLERKLHLEEEMRIAQRLESVGRLAGGIAHEFNNLLTVISGHAAMIGETAADEDSQRSAAKIGEAGNRAAELTRQILSFSRNSALFDYAICGLDELARQAASIVPRLLGESIAIEVLLGAEGCNVSADANHIEQVIHNLVLNARDAMPGGGKLTIATAIAGTNENGKGVSAQQCLELYGVDVSKIKAPRTGLIIVRDTGTGMDNATFERIFDPFFTTKGVARATGMGLTVAHGIVQQHSGVIGVRSAPGQGSTFTIALPVVAGEGRLPAQR